MKGLLLRFGRAAGVLVVAVVLATGCGGDGATSTGPGTPSSVETSQPGASDDADAGVGVSTLQSAVFDNAEFSAELVTEDGTGRVFVVVDCDPVTGGNFVTINPVGFAAGLIITAELDPDAGGSIGAQIGPAGSGVGARQTTLEDAQYTLSIVLSAETLEISFPGCA